MCRYHADNVALHYSCSVYERLPDIAVTLVCVCVSSSSWVRGVEPDSGGLRQAAVSAGAVPEGSVPPAVNQQAVRGRRPPALTQVLQVHFPL